MDYVVGSVAALISGNVTPNRPKLIRRAFTPTKHQPSPNVTPKSEFVEDRSIFLSPTQQKKNAIVKKSPKRIFDNPDLDSSEECEGNSSLPSPKAEKIKKHLKEELEADEMGKKKLSSHKSPSNKLEMSVNNISPKKKLNIVDNDVTNESTQNKKKKKRNSETSNVAQVDHIGSKNKQVETTNITESNVKNPKKLIQRRKSLVETTDIPDEQLDIADSSKSNNKQKKTKTSDKDIVENKLETQKLENNHNEKKKNKKRKNKDKKLTEESKLDIENTLDQDTTHTEKQTVNKKKKKKSKQGTAIETEKNVTKTAEKMEIEENNDQSESDNEEVKSKNIPNPNAITEKDSDSEHDSDNEMESENEQTNEKILTNENDEQNQSSDEEEKEQENIKKKAKKNEDKGKEVVITEEEIKRTLFVGNVPFSSKCKKEIKKIFNKYGQIETIRIRTIPVKDARVTPKLAVIKNELHPERTTVNVYVKYADPVSVSKAIDENNTVLNGNHLRVSRSASSGAEHDPHCAVFVGNLPFAIEDETLRAKFDKCGEIASVRIIRDKKTNAGKGFGYVNFCSKDGVELALALSDEDLTIKNRIIRVKRCTQGQSQGKRPGGQSAPPVGKWNQRGGQREEGAARRLMYKRKQQDDGGGPPHKKQHITQPSKEKKPRKEFVGMTAEKKKKQKFNKGQKKRKALSEILTKKA